jgi:hypothetical protein
MMGIGRFALFPNGDRKESFLENYFLFFTQDLPCFFLGN